MVSNSKGKHKAPKKTKKQLEEERRKLYLKISATGRREAYPGRNRTEAKRIRVTETSRRGAHPSLRGSQAGS